MSAGSKPLQVRPGPPGRLVQEAAEHDRLRSDTYQRLNLGVMWWAAGCLAVAWLAGGPAVSARPLAQG